MVYASNDNFSEQEGEEGHDDPGGAIGNLLPLRRNGQNVESILRSGKKKEEEISEVAPVTAPRGIGSNNGHTLASWIEQWWPNHHVPSLVSPPVLGLPTRTRRGMYVFLRMSPLLLCSLLLFSGGRDSDEAKHNLRSQPSIQNHAADGMRLYNDSDNDNDTIPTTTSEALSVQKKQSRRRVNDDGDGECDIWACVSMAKTWISNYMEDMDDSEEYLTSTNIFARPPGHSRRHLHLASSNTPDHPLQSPTQLYHRTLEEDTASQPTTTVSSANENTDSASSSEADAAAFTLPYWANIVGSIILVAFSALFSGLTLGLMGLDKNGLEIVMAGDDPVAAKNARDIYPLRKNGNLLLCTLLLGNVAVNALLSILMAAFAGGLVGFVLSTALLVVFGEIIPQAVCSRYALIIGSRAVPLVRVIVFLVYPIAFPLSWLLDRILGHELGTIYTKAEMRKLLEIHAERGGFDKDMASAMTGALKYQDVKVSEVMTPWEKTFTLSENVRLSYETIVAIFKAGFSRIPVYQGTDRNQIVGLLFVKDLIFIDPEDETPLRSFVRIFSRAPSVVWPDDSLGDVLRDLKQGRSHMALVRDVNNDDPNADPFYEIKGIITLEDVIEVILGDEIMDETDALEGSGGGGNAGNGGAGGGGSNGNGGNSGHASSLGQGSRRHDFDWDRLRFLDTKIVDKKLTPNEEKAVTAYLRANYSEDLMSLLTDAQLQEMVSSTCVTELKPPGSEEDDGIGIGGGLSRWDSGGIMYASSSWDVTEADMMVEHANEEYVTDDDDELMEEGEKVMVRQEERIREPHMLYQRSVETDFCALILSGKLTVLAGADEFQSDAGPWSVLGKQALTESAYKPDFTAYATSETCRCLLFTRERFTAAVDASTAERLAAAAARERKLMEAAPGKNGSFRGSLRGLGPNNSTAGPATTTDGSVPSGNNNESKRGLAPPQSYRKSRRSKLMAAFHKTTEMKRIQLAGVAMANKHHKEQQQKQEQQEHQQKQAQQVQQEQQQQVNPANGGGGGSNSRLSPPPPPSRNVSSGSRDVGGDNSGRVGWTHSASYDEDAEELVSLHAKLTNGGVYAARPRVKVRSPQPHLVKSRSNTPPPPPSASLARREKKNSCASASTTTTSRSSTSAMDAEVILMNGHAGNRRSVGGGGDRSSTHGVIDSREDVGLDGEV